MKARVVVTDLITDGYGGVSANGCWTMYFTAESRTYRGAVLKALHMYHRNGWKRTDWAGGYSYQLKGTMIGAFTEEVSDAQ